MKLMIVDDHDLFRRAMVALLTQTFPEDEITCGDDSIETIKHIESNQTDIVLLDVQMPSINGVEFLKMIRAAQPATKVIMLTQLDNTCLIFHCVQLGASGFLLKTSSAKELQFAIRAVHETGQFFNKTVIEALQTTVKGKGLANLTFNPVELKLLTLLKNGCNSKEISKLLGLTEMTIDSYRKDLMAKAKVRNVAELISFGYRSGLLFPAQSRSN